MTFMTLSPYLVVGAILAAAAAMLVNYFIRLFRGQTGCANCSSCSSSADCSVLKGKTAPGKSGQQQASPRSGCASCSSCPSAPKCEAARPEGRPRS